MTREKTEVGRFYVSGVIKFEVSARDEEEALKKADDRAQSLMRAYATVYIDTDPDTVEEKSTLTTETR